MADSQLTSPESKCPHASQDRSTQENDAATLSKSKKKRLRKKRKIEAEASVKREQEVVGPSVRILPIRVNTSATKLPTQSDQKSNHSTSILEKGHKINVNTKLPTQSDQKSNHSISISEKGHKINVKTVSSSDKPNSTNCSSVPVKCNSKPKEDFSQRNLEHPAEDSVPVAGYKVESGALGESRDQQPKMNSKTSRDDVIAQREAKKLAKLAKKNKSGSGSVTTSGKDVSSDEPAKENPLNANTPKAQNTASAQVKTTVVAKTANDVQGQSSPMVQPPKITNKDVQGGKPPVKVASGTTANNHRADMGDAVPQPSSEPGKTEKTREEIMAEREAKKQAKLAAKNKKKDPGQPTEPAAAAPLEKDNSAKTEITGDAVVRARSPANDKPDSNKENVESRSASEKSKAQLRAERRAKQEAQRAAKEAVKTKPPSGGPSTKPETVKEKIPPSSKATSKPTVQSAKPTKSVSYQPKLLSHLQMDNRPLPAHIYQNVHPAIVELGAKYAARVVSGSNARCIALLQALKKVIADFVTPREKEFSRAMESRLNDSMAFLNASRQSSVSMTNALKHVKSHLTQLATEKTTTDDEARRKLFEVIDTFIREQIDVAGEAICNAIAKKISNGDTIAIYGCSSLLLRILVESRSEGKDFEVVVVDGGPLYEGREMCRRLVAEDIRCSYVLLPAFSYIVGQTSKVLLGAHALLANGCVMSRSGTALVAMLAKAHNVPVIVCCETYKFCERVQADAFVHNEIGPQNGSGSPPLFSLMYDMTPPTLVDAVATELAILPCTSVPVILRVKPSDVSSYYY